MLGFFDKSANKFYYHYLRFTDKKNKNNDWDFFMVVLLFIPALVYLGINKFVPVITKYYPFSLLFQNKLIHHKYTKERSLSDYIEKTMTKKGYPFNVKGVGRDNYFITFHGYFFKGRTKKGDRVLLKIVESKLKLEKGSIYLRDSDKNRVRIIVPTEYILK